ncbi:nitroreductase family protein [Limibacter armeniacum]|uniref:nitroreductase family protein n=1 Tax=Limibacter armeniacum TaxID=466084 RepID=UPI002FE64FE9
MIETKSKASVFEDVVRERRSVRIYDQNAEFDQNAVKRSLENAVLAPNSSNMQLWEFYRIKDKQTLQQLSKACLGQQAASTAHELVVFVARPDLWKKRQKVLLDEMKKVYEGRTDKKAKRAISYYTKLMPMLYGKSDRFGFSDLWKKAYIWFEGLKRPVVRQVGRHDVRITIHKSVSLAAMTFMYSMQAEGYNTCPMEGFDSKIVKNILGLPTAAEITMIIGCGPAAPEGIYSERFRVANEEVIFEI